MKGQLTKAGHAPNCHNRCGLIWGGIAARGDAEQRTHCLPCELSLSAKLPRKCMLQHHWLFIQANDLVIGTSHKFFDLVE